MIIDMLFYKALLTPFYGDQFVNSAFLEKRGMGKILYYEDLNYADKVYDALVDLLQPRYAFVFYGKAQGLIAALTHSYTNRAKIISTHFRNRPKTPLETSIWWIQYILANGGELIKSPATNMSWFVYYSVDVMLLLVCTLICTIYGICRLVNVCRGRTNINVDSKKRD